MITGPESAELRAAGGVIERAAIIRWAPFTLEAGANTDALRLAGLSVSPELFDVLGVQPRLGRGFRPDETGSSAPDVIVLSDRLWRQLGADPTIVGRTVRISAMPFTVIGVAPAGFNFSGSATADVGAYLPLYDDLPVQPPLIGDWMAVIRARGLLIDVSPFDLVTLVAVTIGLTAVTLLACYVAAKPVATIEPELLRDG